MSRPARSRLEDRAKTRKTLDLLRYCACRKRVLRFRRVLTRIEREQIRTYRRKARKGS